MTKQEKIGAGLLKIIADEQNYATYEETRDQIVEYLHSEDVVIKVDRKLPEVKVLLANGAYHLLTDAIGYTYKEAGYTATEPLIKEEKKND